MSEPVLKVLKTGLKTSFQDFGRTGYLKFGVVQSGAMDSYSAQMANLLVGNNRNEACIEMTITGGKFEALDHCVIAICGADLSPQINNKPTSTWKSIGLKKGDILTFKGLRSGVRTYMAVSGGLDIPPVLGSRSYFDKIQLGTEITEGTVFYLNQKKSITYGIGLSSRPFYPKEAFIRVVPGPHEERFTEEGIDTFYNSKHKVSVKADRMGIHLDSPKVTHIDGADVYSDAIPLGGIQIPSSGKPIIMMADRQATGGYTRIATVVSVDIPILTQLSPGSTIQFKKVSVEEAQWLCRQSEKSIWLTEQFLKHMIQCR